MGYIDTQSYLLVGATMGLVNLVRDDCASAFKKHLAQAYNETTGIAPDVYICEPAQGTAAWPAEASVQV